MNAEAEPPATIGAGVNPALVLPLLLAAALGALAVSAQSVWMDEAATAIIAAKPGFSAWFHTMINDTGSDQQMPLYMLFVWGWEKVWGYDEAVLRAANLPWLVLALAALPRRPATLLPLVLVSPFLWFYLNEARPYALQICAGLMLLGAVARLAAAEAEKIFVAVFAGGLVLLAGSSLIGMIWAGAFLVATGLVLSWGKCRRLMAENLMAVALAVICLVVLAAYYLWTLTHASTVTPGGTGLSNLIFAGYELLGFAGLGPGRNEIRTDGLAAFNPFWPLLVLPALTTAVVLAAGVKKVFQTVPRRVWLGVVAAFAAATLFLLAVGVLKHFRVLGRHFAPLAPVLLLLLAVGVRELLARGKLWRVTAWLFIAGNLASALSVRFADRHAKDDYRGAAELVLAAAAQNQRAWWCADINAAVYYGLPLTAVPTGIQPWAAVNIQAAALTNQPAPDLVVLSKPELYDPRGYVRDWLAQHHFHVTDTPHLFTVWRAAGASAPALLATP
jgi:hypothetical protein